MSEKISEKGPQCEGARGCKNPCKEKYCGGFFKRCERHLKAKQRYNKKCLLKKDKIKDTKQDIKQDVKDMKKDDEKDSPDGCGTPGIDTDIGLICGIVITGKTGSERFLNGCHARCEGCMPLFDPTGGRSAVQINTY
jgi:hypothetical protein